MNGSLRATVDTRRCRREERVPQRKVRVTRANRGRNLLSYFVAKQPGFPTICIEMRMSAEEGLKRRSLVPANEQLRRRIPEKASDVGARKCDCGKLQSEQHGDARAKVSPVRRIVSRPHRTVALAPCEEGARQHKRAIAIVTCEQVTVVRCAMHEHAVEVVQIAVLPAARVSQMLCHGLLGPVENGWLVHVDPCVQVFTEMRVSAHKALCPGATGSSARKVKV
mmetsp:Transcript_10684/g.28545  ORF Transcript_10684/g.28545 Transcript_10684/m.28545 type:complete len:223 (-) Transcript_10684:617-1285(-)